MFWIIVWVVFIWVVAGALRRGAGVINAAGWSHRRGLTGGVRRRRRR